MNEVKDRTTLVKGFIATSPFPDGIKQVEIKNGLAFTAKHRLVHLVTRHACIESDYFLEPGTVIAIRAGDAAAPWAREVFEEEGQPPFILVPTSRVVYVGKAAQ